MGKPSKGSKSNSKASKPAGKPLAVAAPARQIVPAAKPTNSSDRSRGGQK